MARITTSQDPRLGGQYKTVIACDQSEAVTIEYTMAPTAGGNADVPTAATLTLAEAKGDTATYSAACTVTDNTTSYTVSVTIPQTTIKALDGVYYFSIVESRTTGAINPVKGEITVFESVEVQA